MNNKFKNIGRIVNTIFFLYFLLFKVRKTRVIKNMKNFRIKLFKSVRIDISS